MDVYVLVIICYFMGAVSQYNLWKWLFVVLEQSSCTITFKNDHFMLPFSPMLALDLPQANKEIHSLKTPLFCVPEFQSKYIAFTINSLNTELYTTIVISG